MRSYEAWWQWWVRGQRWPPVPFTGLVVDAGDLMIASLTVLAPKKVRVVLKNQRTGQLGRHEPDAPGFPNDLPVRGAAAEWITERPTDLQTDALYPLPDYGSVTFSDCLAVSGELRNLDRARLLRMFEVRENRVKVISKAKKLKRDEVQTTYRGA